MQRRDFLIVSGSTALGAVLPTTPTSAFAQLPAAKLEPGKWRVFEIVTEVELTPDNGASKIWIPMPMLSDAEYHRALSVNWNDNATHAGVFRDPVYGAPAFYAQWDKLDAPGKLTITKRIATRNRSLDLSQKAIPHNVDRDELALYLKPTDLKPTDGIVLETARKITAGIRADDNLAKGRAVYEWIVENTFRDPKTEGCGRGDIKFMLESGNLSGKCADLNALFTGLCRAAGVPARDLYGVRVANSATFKSLGKAGDITKAQHCRAEFYDSRYGWIPVDPADVRKVVLEEDGGVKLDSDKAKLARARLFGNWEMNWMGYNNAGDTRLSPQTEKPLGHFMYPHGETAKGRLNQYAPETFKYKMTSKEIAA
jgi:transglutaminase-like putative cysteine protease